MKIGLGSDAKGLMLKEHLKRVLVSNGYEIDDVGTYALEPRVSYPDIASKVGRGVARGLYDRGVLICGTGLGMSIAANKIRGVRAALVYEMLPAILSREHNDANVFCTSGWTMDPEYAGRILLAWLDTRFAGGRNQVNLDRLFALEDENLGQPEEKRAEIEGK